MSFLTLNIVRFAFFVAAAIALSGCGKSSAPEEGDSHAVEGSKHADHAEAKGGHSEKEELTLTTEEAERAGVKVEEIAAQALRDSVAVTATIRPDQDTLANVSPRIEGRITSASVKLGDRVGAGQTLATLDSVEVGEAHTNWARAITEARIAEADFKRAESLNAEEIIPRKEFLRAQSERDKATAAVQAAKDRLRLLGASPSGAGSNPASFSVVAPFSGTIVQKKATLGDLARPGDPMFTIADLGRLWIQADLPEAALAKVQVGAGAKVQVPAYPEVTFPGRVTHIGAMLDKETRTVPVRIEVSNADGRLKPEMFATVSIETGAESRSVIALPDAAIVLMQGVPTVFVYEQGAYEMRPVETGDRTGGRTVVKAGIKAGEQVVTAGAYALKARQQKSQLGHGH